VARARAVVIGAGIGGLAAAAGLCSAGWDVTAFERATSLEPVGAGLAGNELRALAVPQELGIRRSDGRWLMRSTTGHMIADRFGDPVILVTRAAVIDALTARVPDGVLSLGTEVTSLEPGGNAAARISTTAGPLEADLVVAADGIGSATRPALFPAHPGLRHTNRGPGADVDGARPPRPADGSATDQDSGDRAGARAILAERPAPRPAAGAAGDLTADPDSIDRMAGCTTHRGLRLREPRGVSLKRRSRRHRAGRPAAEVSQPQRPDRPTLRACA
jgi:2-polyprenyl-6-methoxyphenol hydroxylase-like FAD-dependent oxidoreductase